MNGPAEAPHRVAGQEIGVWRLALQAALLAVICAVSTQIGMALKFPPHNISPLWPTGPILFCVLVITPSRHWWVYIPAAYLYALLLNARDGFPVWAMIFNIAGITEFLIAAVVARRYANGPQAFESLHSLAAYLLLVVVLAPFASSFVAALASPAGKYLSLIHI